MAPVGAEDRRVLGQIFRSTVLRREMARTARTAQIGAQVCGVDRGLFAGRKDAALHFQPFYLAASFSRGQRGFQAGDALDEWADLI